MSSLWTETYQHHFLRYFQKPFDVQVYHDQAGFALKLATHDWALRGFRIYASIGLADKRAKDEDDDFGEVILFSDVPDREVPELFVHALFFILQQDIPLRSRFAVGFAESHPDFRRRHGKGALYFTRPMLPDVFFAEDPATGAKVGRETFDKLRQGEAFGRVYQAFFITPNEDAFLDAWGPDRFEEKLFEQPDAALSVRRASCL